MVDVLFFDGLGIPYSRWVHGVLALGTIILVVYYLARFIGYIQEQKEKKRFGLRCEAIFYPDPQDLEYLMNLYKDIGDITGAERLKKKFEERLEERKHEDIWHKRDWLQRIPEIKWEGRRRQDIEDDRRMLERMLQPTKARSEIIEKVIEKLRRLRKKRESETE